MKRKKRSGYRRWSIRVELKWIADSLRAAGYRGGDPGNGWIDGVSIDTRAGCSGALFVALRGSRTDGHDFLGEAVKGGAAALLVSSERRDEANSYGGGAYIFGVPDTLAGLQVLATAYAERVDPRVVAVTGSSGKTGTKDLIASILSSRFNVHATPGNMNNHIGLPLTVLGMEGNEDILVAELGANHKKEIKRLAQIARPKIGVVTNIGPCHLEFFGSLNGVASAKAELVQALPPEGTAVLPADDDFLDYLKERTRAAVVTFGFSEGADWRIEDIEKRKGAGYSFGIGGYRMNTKKYGRHHMLNAAAAAAVGFIMDVPADKIAQAVLGVGEVEGRGVLYDLGGIIFMDSSYNSNPASLKAEVDAFMEVPITGKRWLVLGDMLELGEKSADLHSEAGIYCGKVGVDGLFTLGKETVELNRSAAAQRKAPADISHFIDTGKLSAHLNGLILPGDGVLVKGSRAMQMERVLDEIEKLRKTKRRRLD